MSLKVEEVNFEEFAGVKEIYTIAHHTFNDVQYITVEMLFSEMPRKHISTSFKHNGIPIVDNLFILELSNAIREYSQKNLALS